MCFARNLSLDKPCVLNNFTPKKLLEDITSYSRLRSSLLMYSPVCLKSSYLFKNNKCLDNSWNNYIIYTPYNEEKMRKLKEEEEKEKKYLDEIFERAKEKRRKMREERRRKEKEEQERKELFEKAERDRIEREERAKKEQEEREKALLEGQEGNPENKEGEENPENVEENKEEVKEEQKEEVKEEQKEEAKEEQKEGEEEKKEEVKEGEENQEQENPENQEEHKEGEEEKKEGEEEEENENKPTKEKETMQPINSDRSSIPRESVMEDKQSKGDEFKNLVMDNNYIMFHFLSSKEEVDQFLKSPDDFLNYILKIKRDIKPPKILSPEKIAEILFQDKEEEIEEHEEEENQDSKEDDSENLAKKNEGLNKFSLNVKYEYQDCCPVDIVENNIKRIGKVAYSMKYNGKYYKFSSMENMEKFKLYPKKYINLDLPVRKVNLEQNKLSEKKILFNNTVNFLEFTFGSLITKGMLELSNNRIKYPYLNVKESSLKYLALFLKANNPKNNKYAQEKYKKILKEFKRNSELPWELFNVYENYNKEKDNVLNKKLMRKQLDTVSVKYDKLMEKAKIQNNTRFANFFRINNEANEEEKNE